jgi:hypothetical protein
MRIKTCQIVGLAALILGVAPTLARANLPSSRETRIVVFKSIGGVSFGESVASARKAWGPVAGAGSSCTKSGCMYVDGAAGTAQITADTPGVADAGVSWFQLSLPPNETTDTYDFSSPITKFKTGQGIGLGSTFARLETVYPKFQQKSIQRSGRYDLYGPKHSELSFLVEPDGSYTALASERVVEITMERLG